MKCSQCNSRAKTLTQVYQRRVVQREETLDAVDTMAMALPDGFVWPVKMRRAYERAVLSLSR